MHRCQRLIVLLDMACHGTLFNQNLIAMQPTVQLAMVQFWSSFIISNDKCFEEARTGGLEQTTGHSESIQAHSSETHQCGPYSTTFWKHTSKYYNTRWD